MACWSGCCCLSARHRSGFRAAEEHKRQKQALETTGRTMPELMCLVSDQTHQFTHQFTSLHSPASRSVETQLRTLLTLNSCTRLLSSLENQHLLTDICSSECWKRRCTDFRCETPAGAFTPFPTNDDFAGKWFVVRLCPAAHWIECANWAPRQRLAQGIPNL